MKVKTSANKIVITIEVEPDQAPKKVTVKKPATKPNKRGPYKKGGKKK